MKLNNKRTLLVGFAFLSICAFWQMYDSVIPKILTETFQLNKTLSGAIMAADNVLALFLLPLFGSISDKSRSKMGKRRPFILVGTIAAVILMNLLPVIDNSYAAFPSSVKLVYFVVSLGLLLIAMGTYRSPAVALMPDVTPKPLRSKANAIINLMGAVGGVLFLIVTTLLYSSGSSRVKDVAHVDYSLLFIIVAGIMIVSVIVVMLTINERKIEKEMQAYEAEHPEEILTEVDKATGKAVLPKDVKKSLGFLLASIALWFIGYNAITTWFTVYAQQVWGMALGDAALCLTVATVGAIISYIPIGVIATKFGRKKTIMAGVVLLAACFFGGYIFTLVSSTFSPVLYVLFVLVGLAWAAINVNSLPMVVEMCAGSDVGKFTGYYYTFSMAAQTITPIISGTLMEQVSHKTLFPYAAIAVAIAFVTMLFVKHGDNKVESPAKA